MASTSRMLRIFGRRLIEANNTVKPIQNIFFQKPKTNNVGTKCFVNSKLLHSQNRQEEAGGKLQYKTKSKWLQFGKLGLLVVASTTAAAGFTYLTLLKDVKAGPKRNKIESFPEEESVGQHQTTEDVDLEDNLLIDTKVKVFTKDELKEFCQKKNHEQLKFYAVSEKDMEDNKVLSRKVSNDEYKKLMNENFDSYFKKETGNWIPLPLWNMFSKSERIMDTNNESFHQYETPGDYKDAEKDYETFSPVEQKLKKEKNFPIRVGKTGDVYLTVRGESTYSETKKKKQPQDVSIPTLEMRKKSEEGIKITKFRYIPNKEKVESVPELDEAIQIK